MARRGGSGRLLRIPRLYRERQIAFALRAERDPRHGSHACGVVVRRLTVETDCLAGVRGLEVRRETGKE